MIGDILVIGDKHHRAAAAILEALGSRDLKGAVIAVAGESGAGKSETAHLIRKELQKRGLKGKIIHSDNYYLTTPDERSEWRKSHGVKESVGINEINWALMNGNIAAFRAKSSRVEMPFIDIVTGQIDTLVTDFTPIDTLIVEGLYAINADVDFSALIDLTYHETKDMQSLRGKEPVNQFRAEVLEAEHQALLSIRNKANLIITKEMMGLK